MRLADLDGRTKARKAADAMFQDLISDMGGEQHVSAGKRALAESAAVLKAAADDMGARYLLGEGVDIAAYATITNALRRLLADIGLERRSRDITPDLSRYIEGKASP